MDDLTWVLLFYVIGLVAMIIEMFIPGAVMGIMGFLAVCGSLVYAFMTGHTTAGTILVVVTILFIPLFFLVWKSVLRRLFAVKNDEKDFRSSMQDYEELLGKEGAAASALRPSGTAVIESRRYAVVTRGEMIDRGARVKVIDVAGSRLTVKEL